MVDLHEAGRTTAYHEKGVVTELMKMGIGTIMVLTPKANPSVSIICVPPTFLEAAAMIILAYHRKTAPLVISGRSGGATI